MNLLEKYSEWKKVISIFINTKLDLDDRDIRESFSDYVDLKEIISKEEFIKLEAIHNNLYE